MNWKPLLKKGERKQREINRLSKNVPSPSVNGPLSPPPPPDGGVAAEVVGAGCSEVEVGGGGGGAVELVTMDFVLWGFLTMSVTPGIEGEEEDGVRHLREFRRLTATSEEFEEVEATRAATTRR
jgi:hypothetical protein